MSYSRIGLVTGSNKGVGLACIRQIALQYPNSKLNNGKLLLYLCSRSESRGQDALQSIQSDSQLAQAKALERDGGLTKVVLASVDVQDRSSVDQFVDMLKQKHGQIDFAINNAGVAFQGFDNDVVQNTLAINYYGTLYATERFLSILKPDGRIANVSSMAGRLGKYPQDLQKRFLEGKTVGVYDGLMKEFADSVKDGTHTSKGWPSAAYAVSKAGLIGATRAIALREHEKGSKVLINFLCPGFVQTDMTRGGGSKTPDQGAQTPVMLVLGDINETGQFWQHEKHLSWV